MKKTILLFFLVFFIPSAAYAYRETDDTLRELSGQIEEFDFYGFSQELRAGGGLDRAESLTKKVAGLFGARLKETEREVGIVLVPVILFGVLSSLKTENESGAVRAAYLGCFGFVCVVLTGIFSRAVELVEDTAATVDIVHKGLIPVLFANLAAMGSITRAVTLKPVAIAASQIIMQIIRGYILPFIMSGFGLILAEGITGFAGLKRLGEFILKAAKWALAFVMFLFVAVLSAQSLMAGSIDSVAVKSGKFAVSRLIPVVGSAVSEGMETLSASVKVIKNSAGIAGVAGVGAITLYPLIKIFACALMFHIIAAFCFPFPQDRFGDIFSAAGNTMATLGAVIISMSFVFIITAAVIISANPAV